MAAIKFKNAKGVERGYEEGFGGIDLGRSQKRRDKCRELSNLDISADSSLRSRHGYTEKLVLSAPLRATFTSGKDFYALAGNKLTLTDTATGSTSVLGEVGASAGDGDIFCFGGVIFVHDSQKLYHYDGTALVETEGYAPLYGKDWDPIMKGEVNEPINIVSNRMIVSFTTITNTPTYDVGLNIESVDRMVYMGNIRDHTDLVSEINGSVITLSRTFMVAAGNTMTFWVTLSESERKKSMIAASTKSFVFSNSGGERLCLYSPGTSNRLLCSLPVDAGAIEQSKLTAPASIGLYMPVTSAILAGNGAYPIMAMSSHFDRALLFTDANTWCVDYEGGELDTSRALPSVFILNSAIGGERIFGDPHYDSDPITYFRGRLFRWHSQSGVRDECSAELISDEVAELIPKDSENVSMLSLPHRGQLFIADGDDSAGRMLVYNSVRGAWTEYDGIYAEKLFTYGSSPAFSRGEKIYVLTETAKKDSESGGTFMIESKLVTRFTDFGTPEREKRSLHVILDIGECASGQVTLTTDKGEQRSFNISGKSGMITERLSMPRFRKLSLTLESIGKLQIKNIILSAK